jgi:hypothetical protein
VKRLFLVLTALAALALPAAITSACIVDCCAMTSAMKHCGGMAKVIAMKPLKDAATPQKSAPSMRPARAIAHVFTSPVVQRVAMQRPVHSQRGDRDVGLHLLLATLLI